MAQTINNLSETWNSSGTTFTGVKYNVTDTASAATSLLMDLQVGGVSKFKVDKSGAATVSGGFTNSGDLTVAASNFYVSSVGTGFALLNLSGYYGFTPSGAASSISTTADLRLYRDLANTLAQRNGTNAQTSRLYGTYTDASNYRRLTKTMSAAGVAEIKPEGAGTGATGNVLYISGLPTSNPGPGILWNNGGVVNVGT